MYFFYICNLTNDYTKMKKKIMNVCGMAFLAISVLACSGQKKGATDTVVSADSVKEDNRLLGRFILMFEAAFRSP